MNVPPGFGPANVKAKRRIAESKAIMMKVCSIFQMIPPFISDDSQTDPLVRLCWEYLPPSPYGYIGLGHSVVDVPSFSQMMVKPVAKTKELEESFQEVCDMYSNPIRKGLWIPALVFKIKNQVMVYTSTGREESASMLYIHVKREGRRRFIYTLEGFLQALGMEVELE